MTTYDEDPAYRAFCEARDAYAAAEAQYIQALRAGVGLPREAIPTFVAEMRVTYRLSELWADVKAAKAADPWSRYGTGW